MRYFRGEGDVHHGVRLFIDFDDPDIDPEICEVTCDNFTVALRLSEWLLYDIGVKDVKIEVVHFVTGNYVSGDEEE